jgi:ribosomal-protein-alanine N-acetyltransferase
MLETERLVLRDCVMTDWEALNAMLADPLVTRYMHFAFWDEQQRRAWLEEIVQEAQDPQRHNYNWALALRSDGLLIGWLGIGWAMHPAEPGTRECGYALAHRFWRQGYMPEALRAVIAYEFNVLGTLQIIATCQPQNPASARVMQKSGMTYVGTFDETDPEGHPFTELCYAIRNKPA